jgi:hypothetical protein
MDQASDQPLIKILDGTATTGTDDTAENNPPVIDAEFVAAAILDAPVRGGDSPETALNSPEPLSRTEGRAAVNLLCRTLLHPRADEPTRRPRSRAPDRVGFCSAGCRAPRDHSGTSEDHQALRALMHDANDRPCPTGRRCSPDRQNGLPMLTTGRPSDLRKQVVGDTVIEPVTSSV